MISPALALASHRRGARTGAGAAAARTRRDNSRDIDSMLAPAAGDCDRVSHALRLALFGALVWLCADREQPFVATRAGECRRRRSHGRQQAAACGWGLTFRSFLCRDVRALTVCRSNTLWLLPQRRHHLRCRRPYLNNIAARGAPTANPRRRRLSRARSGLAFGQRAWATAYRVHTPHSSACVSDGCRGRGGGSLVMRSTSNHFCCGAM